MKLFLCSHFSSVGSLIKEEIDNKRLCHNNKLISNHIHISSPTEPLVKCHR